jgi:hypothetical protein
MLSCVPTQAPQSSTKPAHHAIVFAARTQPYGLLPRLQATPELAPVAACHDRATVVYDALRRSVYASALRIALSEAPAIPQNDAHWRFGMGFALCPWPGNHWRNIRTVLIDRRYLVSNLYLPPPSIPAYMASKADESQQEHRTRRVILCGA